MKIASAQGRADLCTMGIYNRSDDNLRAYMTTAYVARDMLEILKADTLSREPSGLATLSAEDWRNAFHQDPNILNFIGTAFLGNPFASLYPQHVGKMLLDGNINAEN